MYRISPVCPVNRKFDSSTEECKIFGLKTCVLLTIGTQLQAILFDTARSKSGHKTSWPPPPSSKTLLRKTVHCAHADRSKETAVIFLFGLEAVFTRVSRAQSSAVSSRVSRAQSSAVFSLPAVGSYRDQTNFPFFPLFCVGPGENTPLLKCRHPHSLALSFYIKSLPFTPPPLRHIIRNVLADIALFSSSTTGTAQRLLSAPGETMKSQET
jgi:hypothetical protein